MFYDISDILLAHTHILTLDPLKHMENKTIYITGATGFLGRNLLDALAPFKTTQLHLMVRPQSPKPSFEQANISLHQSTLHDVAALTDSIPEQCDYVFHIAANTSIWKKEAREQIKDNWDGTKNIVDACLAKQVGRLIHVSSVAAYDYHTGTLNEACEQRGGISKSPYAFSKFKAEEEVRRGIKAGLNAVIINPAHILGPHDRGNWVRMIKMVAENTLPGIPGGTGSFADARQIARGMLTAASQGQTGSNYIMGGPNISFLELVTIMGSLLDKKVPSKTIPDWLLNFVGHSKELLAHFTGQAPDITPQGARHATSKTIVDDSKAQTELDYQHTPTERLLQDTIEWLRQTHQI